MNPPRTDHQHNRQKHVLVCPRWFCWTFDNPIRRLFQNPRQILGGLVRPGDIVLDLGCGMGYYSIALARLVNPAGRVICIDLQEKMLAAVMRRAKKAGLAEHIQLHRAAPDKIGLVVVADFALAFWMLHEVRDQQAFLSEVSNLLRPGAQFLLAEPKVHIQAAAVERAVELARAAGFEEVARPEIAFSHAVLFQKKISRA
jgi:ubiquinone/menaquinone biosynthesis C-methylase UbiE